MNAETTIELADFEIGLCLASLAGALSKFSYDDVDDLTPIVATADLKALSLKLRQARVAGARGGASLDSDMRIWFRNRELDDFTDGVEELVLGRQNQRADHHETGDDGVWQTLLAKLKAVNLNPQTQTVCVVMTSTDMALCLWIFENEWFSQRTPAYWSATALRGRVLKAEWLRHRRSAAADQVVCLDLTHAERLMLAASLRLACKRHLSDEGFELLYMLAVSPGHSVAT